MEAHMKILLIVLLALIAVVVFFMFKQKYGRESFEDEMDIKGLDEEKYAKIEEVPTCVNEMVKENFEPVASDPMDGNGTPTEIMKMENDPIKGNLTPNNCFPKDSLNPEDLLPGNQATAWSKANPSGDGKLSDQNFLHAGFHVGINTVGQSLRNANLQLRSEPPNPTQKVGPWMQSTIEPDLNRKALEIVAGAKQ